ncbi:MAG: hypothetical protein ACOC0W_04740 [Desulfosalsimonas sp.]
MKQQRKKAKHKKDHPIPVAWYTRQQWEILRQVAADSEKMEDSFEKWEASAGHAYRILLESGFVVRAVYVDVAELLNWCRSRNRPLDGEARTDYIEEKLEESGKKRR